jgi:hypothetical protein
MVVSTPVPAMFWASYRVLRYLQQNLAPALEKKMRKSDMENHKTSVCDFL